MSDIINKTSNSIKWTTVNTIFNSAVQPFYRLGLALLLSPTEYGYLSIILLVISLTELLNNMGVGEVLIKDDNITFRETSSIFYFNLLVSVAFAVLFFYSAELIADFYDYRQLENYIKVLSIIVFINGSTSIFKFYLHKYFHFKVTSLLLITRFLLEICITLSLVLYGIGLNGVIIGLILSFGIYGVLLSYFAVKIYSFKVRMYFSLTIVKKYLNSGIMISLQRILNFSSNRIDEVLIGRIFGADVLGQYYLAKSILFQMQSLLSRSFGQVMLPFFSKINNNLELIRTRYIQMVNTLIFVGAPVFLSIFFFADNFIYVFLNDTWSESIQVFQYLVFPTFLMFLNAGVTNSIMISLNRVYIILFIDIITTVYFLSYVFLWDFLSVDTLILTYTSYIYLRVISSKIALWKNLKINLMYLVNNLWRNFAAIFLMAFVFYIIDQFTSNYNMIEVLLLFLVIPLSFILINFLFNRRELYRAINIIRKVTIS